MDRIPPTSTHEKYNNERKRLHIVYSLDGSQATRKRSNSIPASMVTWGCKDMALRNVRPPG